MRHDIESYLPKLKEQILYLNGRTVLIWSCGVLFTRFSTGMWFGDRPAFVLASLLVLVYLYMHIGYYLTMLIRFPLVLLLLYLGHTHLVQSGDFLLSAPIELSWNHVLILWVSMNFSFVFHSRLYPFRWGTLHWMASAADPGPDSALDTALGKLVSFPKRHANIR